MDYVQKKIVLPDYIEPVSFLGAKDNFFNQVRRDTELKMGIQDRTISLYGFPAEVDRITSVLTKMLEVAGSNDYLTENDVNLYLRQSRHGNLLLNNDATTILKIGKNELKVKTLHQQQYVESMRNNILTFGIGSAGVGKSFIAASCALEALKDKEVEQIILIRPPVALGGYEIGFLPGSNEDKIMPWMAPIISVFGRFLSQEKLENYIDSGRIKLLNMSYARGYSFEDCFVIMDEAQLVPTEIFKAIITRIGYNCKMVICGDTKQTEIGILSGLENAANIMKGSPDVGIVRFDSSDCVRSGICAYAIHAFEEVGY